MNHRPKRIMTNNTSASNLPRQDNPFRVLGIALIVDQKGIGPMLVSRYPTQPSSPVPVNQTGESDDQEYSNDDLFFTLTAFQMAKLFRTKKSLAHKPMVRFQFLLLLVLLLFIS